MRGVVYVTIVAISLCGMASIAYADSYECQSSIDTYNAALQDIGYAMKHYSNCVSDSHGHDDCSLAFNRLKSAQNDFESAVSEYGINCQQY